VGQPGPEVTKRSDGQWWKWDGYRWSGPFATADEARRENATRQ
jgi:hypothetical protein